MCFSFSQLFVFHAKSVTTNNHRTGLTDVMYHIKALSIVMRINLQNFKKVFSVEKNRFEVFDFWSNFELISKVASNFNSLFSFNLSLENIILLK